jgi:hypothetical protein
MVMGGWGRTEALKEIKCFDPIPTKLFHSEVSLGHDPNTRLDFVAKINGKL